MAGPAVARRSTHSRRPEPVQGRRSAATPSAARSKRDLILRAATDVFADRGFFNAQVADVARAMLTLRTLLLVVEVAPLAALVSLQFAVVISSRVNDPRTAQQFGVLIILPLTVLLVAQFTGSLWLTNGTIVLIGLGLFVVWILLTLFSVAMFQREAILTKWK